ncbi:msx2-interacting protein-like [Penaeus monodon]|uniref:msx2-interacting protein-like n=1 Tax=Penaeus monodon TaxID=6687 RepID=UPI0018A75850|nr:msx2-interacting protein-like [Penaeus monodon]
MREAEAGAAEGAWDTQARRLPSPPEGRPDTFGHRISEDLSHLDTESSPRKSNRRWSSQVPSLHFSSASSGAHGSFPQRPYEEQNSRWHNSRAGSASGNERSSTRFRNWDREERPSTSPRPSYVDYNAHEYPPRGSYNYPSRARDPVSRGGDPYSNPASRGEPALLTIQQIKQMINISSHDEFFELLKKRGIGFSQLLEYMNRGANEDEVLQLLGYQRTTTTTQPPEARLPQTRLEDEHGGDAFDSQADSSLYFGEGAHRASQGSPFRGGAHLARDEVMAGEAASSGEERRRNRKERKRKGKKNRRRKGKGGRKQRLPDLVYTTDILPVDGAQGSTSAAGAEFGPPSSGTPDVGSNFDRATPTQQPDDARPSTSAAAAVLPGPSPNQPAAPPSSTSQPGPSSPQPGPSSPQPGPSSPQPTPSEEIPDATRFPVVPAEASATQTLSTTMQVFPEPPVVVASATPSATTPDVALPLPTSGHVADDAPTTTARPPLKKSDPALTPRSSSSTLPSPPGDPYADDVTFPPGIRPSEVSIHSITVMKVPEGDETVPEVLAPASRRPVHRRPVVKAHFPTERNTSRFTTTSLEEPEFEIGSRSILVQNIPQDEYQFPIKGLLIISGVLGAMAVFTLVILISYCIIKCSKPPAVNNYRVTEQKPVAQ